MTATPESLTRQWFKEVWNEGREEAIDRLCAADCVVHGLTGADGPPLVGPAAFKSIFHTFRGALGDLEIEILRTVVQGDLCVAHCRVKGKHVGHAFGGSPTQRQVDFEGVTITRTRGDQLSEGWNVFDFLTMYQQIAWIENPVLPSA